MSAIEIPRDSMTKSVLAALRKHALENLSVLPPFRLPEVARRIVEAIAQRAAGAGTGAAEELGLKLALEGLALKSFLAAQNAALSDLCAAASDRDDANARAMLVAELGADVILGMREGAMERMRHQRDSIERALREANERQKQELHRMIQELSTPVVPIADGILLLPLVGRVDAERSERITERLLSAVVANRAEVVITDVTGVSGINADVAARIFATARAVRLLGARMILVGIGPEVATTLVELGVEPGEVTTMASLQRGLEAAQRGQRKRRAARADGAAAEARPRFR